MSDRSLWLENGRGDRWLDVSSVQLVHSRCVGPIYVNIPLKIRDFDIKSTHKPFYVRNVSNVGWF